LSVVTELVIEVSSLGGSDGTDRRAGRYRGASVVRPIRRDRPARAYS